MQDIRKKSPILREMVDKGEVTLVGGILDVSTGAITWWRDIHGRVQR